MENKRSLIPDISNYNLGNMINTARFLLRLNREWNHMHENDDSFLMIEGKPAYFLHYIRLKNTIGEAMRYRRSHRKTVSHIWSVYTESVIANHYKNKGIEDAI